MCRSADSVFDGNIRAEGFVARLMLTVAFVGISVLLAYGPVRNLISTGRSDCYPHVLLMPLVTGYFLFTVRKRIFRDTRHCWTVGAPLIAAGLLAYAFALWQKERLGANDFASLATASCVVFFWGGFVLLYGQKSFRAGLFPFLFLLFAVPVPSFLLDSFIHVLRVGSTEVVQRLYDVTGTTYFREGFQYQLAGIDIEVAKECSGIRSTLALIISSVAVGHLFLKSGWRQLVLVFAVLPITILKNAVRILTLSLLAVYVDTRFITESWLHHSGGIVFYLPALGLLAGILLWLRKGEKESV